jgi:hypothetical protein
MIAKTLLAVALVAALAYLSNDDYSAEQADAAQYLEMVDAGYWPDYLGLRDGRRVRK